MKRAITRTDEAKSAFKRAFQTISREEQNEIFAEAAFPAYAHANPFIDRLFWGRLRVVESYIRQKNRQAVLDFGCGSGVMSWVLSPFAGRVYATDIVPVTFERMKERVEFPSNVRFVPEQEIRTLSSDEGLRTIVVLDVLEHVEDLRGTLSLFKNLMQGQGEVIISGPTENIFYKIGRFIAGRRFTGTYHRTDISHIKKICGEFGSVTPIKQLYPFVPFFDIFSLTFE